VARNITALAATPRCSRCRRRRGGRSLEDLLLRERVDRLAAPRRELSSTVKLRVIGHQQQLAAHRVRAPAQPRGAAAKLDEYERLIDEAHAVVLSDYGRAASRRDAHDRAGEGARKRARGPEGLEYTRSAAPRC